VIVIVRSATRGGACAQPIDPTIFVPSLEQILDIAPLHDKPEALCYNDRQPQARINYAR
jgi:hypothetical protein